MKFIYPLTIVLLLATGQSMAQDRKSPPFQPQVVLPRPMRPLVNSPHVPAAKADRRRIVNDNDLVLGVVIDGDARAYPINMLTGPSREIINDVLGGRPIAATW